MQLTKDTGMRLPQRWASSYNRVACLYIIPTKILSISMTVAMQGKFYQYKDNKGTNWPLYGNMQVMLSLGEVIDLMHWRHFSITTSPCWGVKTCRAARTCCLGALALSVSARAAKIFFPPQLWTPSTNSFAYSQSELHDMNMNDLRLRNKSTHARGLVILLSRWGYTQDAYLNFLYQFTCKNNGDLRLSYCTVLSFRISYTVHSAGAERQRCV